MKMFSTNGVEATYHTLAGMVKTGYFLCLNGTPQGSINKHNITENTARIQMKFG